MKKPAITIIALSILLIALIGSGCLSQNNETIAISGSTTVLPLMQTVVEKYSASNSDVIISVTGGGSGTGIAELIDKSNDIAMSSREIRPAEVTEAAANGINVKEHTIAYDGISVIVNPANPVSNLTLDQLQSIYSGEVTNWKDVGGNDAVIAVISRDSASGTQEYFQEAVMRDKAFRSDMITQSATGAVTQEVSQNDKAIGFIGAAYQVSSVKTLGIEVDGTAVYPTDENVLTGTYPLSRPLYLYTDTNPSKAVQDFIAYILSPAGQLIVKDVGYVPI